MPSYFGPCKPPGDWHHYTFTLISTDLDPKALQPGSSATAYLPRSRAYRGGGGSDRPLSVPLARDRPEVPAFSWLAIHVIIGDSGAL